MLRERAREARNIQSRSAPSAVDLRDRYLVWADDTERLLRSIFDSVSIEEVHTDRFWHIREMTVESARPWELLNTEIVLQADRLDGIADRIEADAQRLAAAPGRVVVPDTNVFLHFRRFDAIDWPAVIGEAPVRLVIPLRVVEELDEKKASRRRDLADRATGVLARLEAIVGPSGGAPVKLADGVTVEVVMDADFGSHDRYRAGAGDSEVIDTCESLAFLTGKSVTLVTGDVSMRLRAVVRGVTAVPMPPELRVPLYAETETEKGPGEG